MDSALRPREIQARIRAGESLDEVARLSGEPAERIQRFAAPVLAEREHVAGLALTSTVRRRGEVGGHRTLRAVVGEQLLAHGVDPDALAWDAWRNEDRRWSVQATWTQDDQERSARFQFDLVSRFSVADDAESRWLIAEDEESVERDELALVHAVGGDPTHASGSLSTARQVDQDEEPTISLPDGPFGLQTGVEGNDWNPSSAATPQEIREELEAEIDAYGLVPEGRSELDVLYDMLSGIAEDSINIYAGLSDPVVSEPVGDLEPKPEPIAPERVRATQPEPDIDRPESEAAADPETDTAEPGSESEAAADPETDTADPKTETAEPETHAGEPEARSAEPSADVSAPFLRAVPTPRPAASAGADASATNPVPAPPTASTQDADVSRSATDAAPGSHHDQPDSGSGQPPLVDDEPTLPVAPGASKRRGARKKRASVPSWDEIMFGGPKPE